MGKKNVLAWILMAVMIPLSGGPGAAGAALADGNTADPQAGKASRLETLTESAALQIAKLTASDAQGTDFFGFSAAVDGETLVVGAMVGDAGPAVNAGAVYIFERDPGTGTWIETAKIFASDPQFLDFFGGSVAISGDTVVVGASDEDGGAGDPLEDAGAIYIFERDLGGPGNWGQAAKRTAADAQAEDGFGGSVAIDGDTILAGASGEDGGGGDPLPDAGAVYLFERDEGGPGNWGQSAQLTAGDAQGDDRFGASVSIDGDTLVVGATREDGGPGDPVFDGGAAYVFERDLGGPGNWGQAVQLFAGDAQADDNFGSAAAIDGDTLVVGARLEDGGPGDLNVDAGAAYVFERDEGGVGNWGQAAQLSAVDAQADDFFGGSVAIYGDSIVVGALGEDGGPGDPTSAAGAAYVFKRSPDEPKIWGQPAKLSAGDPGEQDAFGTSVAVHGGTVVVGAYLEGGGPGDPLPFAGAAYIFPAEFLYLPIGVRTD